MSRRKSGLQGSFGALLRAYRGDAGLTQEELAARAGLSVQAVSMLERGVRQAPRSSTLAFLVQALQLDPTRRRTLVTAARRPDEAPAFAPPAELRQPTTPLIGREREMARLCAILERPGVRLLTLTGAPGVGKTRLALEAARRLAPALAGVVAVPLAPLADAGLVAPAIRAALGLPEDAGRSALEAVVAHCRDRELLLVLDNFEHLPAAATLLPELLARCPDLRLLVTSRASLRVRDEQEFVVPPLDAGPAEALFVQRATAIAPGFQLTPASAPAVAEICRLLDGLPLALELAAPWIRLLEPAALLARLDRRLELLVDGARDLPERQRTLRATLTWSYELLEPDERSLFRALSVFAGGATLDAAHAVAGAALPPGRALLLTAQLVDKNLLVRDETPEGTRVRLLETMRELGRELLSAAGEEAAARLAHAEHCAALARTAERELTGAQPERWLATIERELDNVRAALGWARERGDAAFGLALAARLVRFWELRGHSQEGLAWLREWLSAGDVPAVVRAPGLNAAGRLAWRLADYATAAALCDQALGLFRSLGDRRGEATALDNLAAAAFLGGDMQRGLVLCEQALALRRATGERGPVIDSLTNLAEVHQALGASERAMALLEEARCAAGGQGGLDPARAGLILNESALVALDMGQLDVARARGDEALVVLRRLADREFLSAALHTRGIVALACDDLERARRSFQESLQLRARAANPRMLANCLEGLAATARRRGAARRAAVLHAAAATLSSASGMPPVRCEPLAPEQVRAELLRTLGPERFQRAWTAGTLLTADEAMAVALEGAG